MKRGTYVKRSTYQKVVEENRRLLTDIRVLTIEGVSPERILLIQKWRKKFAEDRRFNAILKQMAEEYFKEHPDLDRLRPKLDSNPKAFK